MDAQNKKQASGLRLRDKLQRNLKKHLRLPNRPSDRTASLRSPEVSLPTSHRSETSFPITHIPRDPSHFGQVSHPPAQPVLPSPHGFASEPNRESGSNQSMALVLASVYPVPVFQELPAITTHDRLWRQAYEDLVNNNVELVKEYQELFNEVVSESDNSASNGWKDLSSQQQMKALAYERIEVMKNKQWMIRWGERKFVVRDQIENIINVASQFSTIGTQLASLDPAHAGLAWAGICVLLPFILNDSSQQKAALDGIEEITRFVARYTMVENILYEDGKTQNQDFEACIIRLYVKILAFQAKAAIHFDHNTARRTLSHIFKTIDWVEMRKSIQEADQACRPFTDILSTKKILEDIRKVGQGIAQEVLLELEKKIGNNRILVDWIDDEIRKSRNVQTENERVIEWISSVQVGRDHQEVRDKLGSPYWSGGQWLLKDSKPYSRWLRSSKAHLWLRGTVGTGKSSLASIIIHDLSDNRQHRLAFFYCFKDRPTNTHPVDILRSLVAQLALSRDGLKVSEEIKKRWEISRRPTVGTSISFFDCAPILIDLINNNGDRGEIVTFVIDALDECSEPRKLLLALKDISDSCNKLRLLLTSRLNVTVTSIFDDALQVDSVASESMADMARYIELEIRDKKRQNDVLTPALRQRMEAVLIRRAEGMFRWVELELDLLLNPENQILDERDFEDRLRQLEDSERSGQGLAAALKDTYDQIFMRGIGRQGQYSQSRAIKALQWVLCARVPINPWILCSALELDEKRSVTVDIILRLCSNFVIVDNSGVLRIAHLSVREYLEPKLISGHAVFAPPACNRYVAEMCLIHWQAVFKDCQRLWGAADIGRPAETRPSETGNEDRLEVESVKDLEESEADSTHSRSQQHIMTPDDWRGLPNFASPGSRDPPDRISFRHYASAHWYSHCHASNPNFCIPRGCEDEIARWTQVLGPYLSDSNSVNPKNWAHMMLDVHHAAQQDEQLSHMPTWNYFSTYSFQQQTYAVSGFLLACAFGFTSLFNAETFHFINSLLYIRNHEGYSGLHIAVTAGQEGTVRSMLQYIAEVDDEKIRNRILNARDRLGTTPLYAAARWRGITIMLLRVSGIERNSGGSRTFFNYGYVCDADEEEESQEEFLVEELF